MATPNNKAIIRATRIIYFAMVMAMVLFSALVLFLKNTGKLPDGHEMADVLRYAIYVLTPISVAAGYFIYRKQLSGIDPSLTLRHKYNQFQAAMLIRASCVQAPGLFGSVCALQTGDESFLLFTGIMVVLLLLWQPTRASIAEDLNLSPEERRKLNDDEGVME